MGHGKKPVRNRGKCQARLFIKDGYQQPCSWPTESPDDPWCWTHAHTLKKQFATEEELKTGTRSV